MATGVIIACGIQHLLLSNVLYKLLEESVRIGKIRYSHSWGKPLDGLSRLFDKEIEPWEQK
jgi:hypothetical protein